MKTKIFLYFMMLCLVFLCTSCSKRIDNPRKPAEEIIRIKLMNISKSKCPIQANGSWKLCCSTKAYYNIPQESSVTFEVYNKKILIKCNQKTIYQGLKFRCEPNGNTMFYIQVQEQHNGQQVWVRRLYAGKLFISLEYSEKDKNHILCIVNHVPIETYLQGVVPWEMNPTWEETALKAQAIVSRTYALYAKYSVKNKKNFDIEDTAPVYKGLFLDFQYVDKINKVINDTRGQVLFYNNFLFKTYFTTCCGGYTACAKEVFTEKNIAPYVGVYCFCSQYSEQNNQDWIVDLSNQKVNELFTTLKLDSFGSEYSIQLEKSPYSNRIKIVHCQKYQNNRVIIEKVISGQYFRNFMGLKSAFFTLNWNEQKQVWQCKGRGDGYGVGLCQYGAQIMATKGFYYDAILLHYYPGSSLCKLW